jgi:AcrR family transcriptional regulator
MSHMTTTKTKTERPLRADAERNRLRILDAAAEVFAERGLYVSLDEIAARAGVGVGTVYRRFADRDELIDALFRARVEEMLGLLEEAAANPDPWEGLIEFIERGSEFQGRNRGVKQLMFSARGGREWVDRVRATIRPAVARLVAAAKEQGKLREDFELTDVPLIEFTLAGTIDFTAESDGDEWRRILGFIVDGMRAQRRRPTPLAAEPLSLEDFDCALERAAKLEGR